MENAARDKFYPTFNESVRLIIRVLIASFFVILNFSGEIQTIRGWIGNSEIYWVIIGLSALLLIAGIYFLNGKLNAPSGMKKGSILTSIDNSGWLGSPLINLSEAEHQKRRKSARIAYMAF